MKNQKMSLINISILAILSIYIFGAAGGLMNANIQTSIEAWPLIPASQIRLINTLPALISLPTMLLVSSQIGKRITYKTSILIGTVLIILGGVAPFFYAPSWTFVLAFRVIIGIGAGFYGIRTALLIHTVPKTQRARYLGISGILGGLSSSIISPITGRLAEISWRHPFLINFFPILIGLFIWFGLKENTIIEETQLGQEDVEKEEFFPKQIILYILLQFIATMTMYPMLSGISTFMKERAVGSATVAGLVISSYLIGVASIGAILPTAQRLLKRKANATGFMLGAIGQMLVLIAPNPITIFFAAFLCGMGFSLISNTFQLYTARLAHHKKLALSSTLLIFATQAGVFASNYFITLSRYLIPTTSEVVSSYYSNVILYSVIGLLTLIISIAPKD